MMLAATQSIQAADATWDGGGTSTGWGNNQGTTNWLSESVPTFNADLNVIFNNTGASGLNTFIGASRIIGSLTFNADATAAVNIRTRSTLSSGDSILTLGSTTVVPSITVETGANVTHTIGGGGGSIALANNLTVTHNGPAVGGGLLQINRPVSGNFGITKEGTGLFYLNFTDNTYTGKTLVNGGRLRILDIGSLGANPASFVADHLTLNGGSLYHASGNLDFGNRGITLGAGGGGYVVNNDSVSSVNGTITGAGNFTLQGFSAGTGTLELAAANTYTGATLVTGSSLTLGASGSIADSSMITVGSDMTFNVSAVSGGWELGASQTLNGTGTVTGAVSIAGTLNPGTGAGVLSFGNALTLKSSASTTIEIASTGMVRGTDYDGITVGGALSYGGALALALGVTFDAGEYHFNLFDFVSDPIGDFNTVLLTGSYSGSLLRSGDVWQTTTNSGNEIWSFSQDTGNLSLTVIPEPSTTLLGGLGTLLLLGLRRRTLGR